MAVDITLSLRLEWELPWVSEKRDEGQIQPNPFPERKTTMIKVLFLRGYLCRHSLTYLVNRGY